MEVKRAPDWKCPIIELNKLVQLGHGTADCRMGNDASPVAARAAKAAAGRIQQEIVTWPEHGCVPAMTPRKRHPLGGEDPSQRFTVADDKKVGAL